MFYLLGLIVPKGKDPTVAEVKATTVEKAVEVLITTVTATGNGNGLVGDTPVDNAAVQQEVHGNDSMIRLSVHDAVNALLV